MSERLLNPVKSTRAGLARARTYKDRAKILRSYDDRFDAIKGFDLRSPDSWTPAQKSLVTRRYKQIDKIVDAQEKYDYDTDLLKGRVKQIRPYFGKVFKPSEGYDLRDIDEWHPSKKKKATRYFLAMAPELMTAKKVVKRMRKPERLEAMILRSDQTEFLPGQTAAVFHVETGRELSIDMNKRGEIIYELDGFEENELRFNIAGLHKDADAEIDRVLAQTDANVFRMKLIVGEGYDVFNRDDIRSEVHRYMQDYQRRRPKEDIEKWDQFMRGLVAFPGETQKAVKSESNQQRALVTSRRKARAKDRAAAKRKWTVAEAKAGHRLKRGELLTGRKGRVR